MKAIINYFQREYIMGELEKDFPEVAYWVRILDLPFVPQIGMKLLLINKYEFPLTVVYVCWEEETGIFNIDLEDSTHPPDPKFWTLATKGAEWDNFVQKNPDYAGLKDCVGR